MPKQAAHGSGTIRERRTKAGKRYFEGAIQVGTDPDGRRRMYYCTGRSKGEVRDKFAHALQDEQQGTLVLGPRPTVQEWLGYWLENVAAIGVRPRVYQRYEEIARLHVVPDLGHLQLDKVTSQHLQALYRQKLEKLAPRTVCHIHRLLHQAFKAARRQRLVAYNVVEEVDPPRVPQKEMQALTAAQARTLLAVAAQDPLEAYYVLSLFTAMRQGEVLGLKWSDVDWDNQVVHVRRGLARVKGVGWIEQEPKTATSRRSIPLVAPAIEALKRHRLRQLEQRLAAGPAWDERNLIFANGVGRPLEPQNILRRSFVPLLEKAGLPRVRIHDLRHSTATLLRSAGVDLKTISEILGHSRISITADLYTHGVPAAHREAMQRLRDLLAGS